MTLVSCKPATVEVSHLGKRFNEQEILRDINLKVEAREIVALMGPSGSGKSVLLRHMAFERCRTSEGTDLDHSPTSRGFMLDSRNIERGLRGGAALDPVAVTSF